MKLQTGINWLAAGGLNLFAVLACAELPTAVTEMMLADKIPLSDYGRFVLKRQR